jgi:hypothetical protein
MSEQERHSYWSRLTPEQQAALTEALAAVALEVQPKTPAVTVQPEGSHRRGPFGTMAIGCTGFILGIILTIGVEAALVAKGLSELGGIFAPGSSSPSYEPEPEPQPEPTPDQQSSDEDTTRNEDRLDCRNPKDLFERRRCSQQRFREQKKEWSLVIQANRIPVRRRLYSALSGDL